MKIYCTHLSQRDREEAKVAISQWRARQGLTLAWFQYDAKWRCGGCGKTVRVVA